MVGIHSECLFEASSAEHAVEIVSVNAGKGLDATVEAGKEYEMTIVIDEKGLDNAIGLESLFAQPSS